MPHVKKGTCCAAIFLETYYHPDCRFCRQWHRTMTGSDRQNNLIRSFTIYRFIEAHRCSNRGTYQIHEAKESTSSRLWLHGPSTLAKFDFARLPRMSDLRHLNHASVRDRRAKSAMGPSVAYGKRGSTHTKKPVNSRAGSRRVNPVLAP